jgi:DNA mismatch repair protein MutS
VIAQARNYLQSLEKKDAHSTNASTTKPDISPQLGLFAPPGPSAVELALREIEPDALTPREALDALYRLKKLS